jgi:hypothetical protein
MKLTILFGGLLYISIPKTYKHAFIHYNNTWIVNRRIAVMKTFTEPELTAFYSQIVKKRELFQPI